MKQLIILLSLIFFAFTLKTKTKTSCCEAGTCLCLEDELTGEPIEYKEMKIEIQFVEEPCGEEEEEENTPTPTPSQNKTTPENPTPDKPDGPIQPEPKPVEPIQPEPTPIQPEPTPVQPKPTPVQPKPKPVQPEPTPVQPEPTPVEPKPEPEQPEEEEAEICGGIESGTYAIKTASMDNLLWNLKYDKIILDEDKSPRAATEKFELTRNDSDCTFTMKLNGQFLEPETVCDVIVTQVIEQQEAQEKKPFDLLFMIDSTHSMNQTIVSVQTYAKTISEKMNEEMKDLDIKFGAVFYQDPMINSGVVTSFDFTNNMAEFQAYIDSQYADLGGDVPEDWVSAYTLALKLSWRDGIKLIVHIADAPAHGIEYCGRKYTIYEKQAQKLDGLTNELCDMDNLFIKALLVPYNKADNRNDPKKSFDRMNMLCNQHRLETGNLRENLIEMQNFDQTNDDPTYFTNMIISSSKKAVVQSKEVCYWTFVAKEGTSENPDFQKWKVIPNEEKTGVLIQNAGNSLYAKVQGDVLFAKSPIILVEGPVEGEGSLFKLEEA